MNKKTALSLLALIIVIGSFLRIYGLGSESFWLDESATVYASQQSQAYILGNIINMRVLVPEYFKDGGGEMPAYFLMSYYWTQLVGLDEFKIRLLPAFFGIASIYVIFLVGSALFNYEAGLISAFILAINYQHINYSQEARMYSLLVLLALLSVYFLLKGLRSNKNAYWFFYVITCVLMLYTHYFAFFVLFFEALFILIFWKKHKKSLKKIVVSCFSIFLLYAPWIPVLIRQFYESLPNSMTLGKPTIFNLAEIFTGFNSWVSPVLNDRIALRAMNFSSLSFQGWLLVICVLSITLIMGIAFLAGTFKNKNFGIFNIKNPEILLLLLWLLVPIIVPFAISVFFPEHSIFRSIKYVLFASPAYYLLVSRGISGFKNLKKTFIVLLVILSIIPLYSYYTNFDKEQWKEVSNYFKENRNNNELILVNGPGNILPLSYYYDIKNVEGVRNAEQARKAVEGKQNFWLVLALEKYFDPRNSVKNYLDANYKIVKRQEFVGVKIFYYAKG